VETRLALLHNSRSSPKFKVITTFGARRSRELPQVPTFAEIAGDRTLAYTISYGVFAPVKTDPAIAARLTAGLISLKDDKNIQAEARLLAIPLHIDGPSAVLQTIDRDRSVAENLTV
jgi:tripartite-type tricarboxylate transporter receptor subunit TctC